MTAAGAGALSLAGSSGVAYAASAARRSAVRDRLSACLPSPRTVMSWIDLVNGRFGPQRLTGDDNHRRFVNWLDSQLSSAGFSVERDTYTFQRWAADASRDVSAWVELSGQDRRPLDVLSPVAYSGSTRGTGPVSGRAVYVPVGDGTLAQAVAALLAAPPADLAECVVVLESPCQSSPAATVWGTDPAGLALSTPHISTPYQWFNPLGATYAELAGRCRGIVYCWTNVSDERARWVYAPPSMAPSTATIPAVWVGSGTAARLRALAGQGARIGIRLDAQVYPHAPTDTLIATLPGDSDEVMAIGSHTDGVNIVEENGAAGRPGPGPAGRPAPPGAAPENPGPLPGHRSLRRSCPGRPVHGDRPVRPAWRGRGRRLAGPSRDRQQDRGRAGRRAPGGDRVGADQPRVRRPPACPRPSTGTSAARPRAPRPRLTPRTRSSRTSPWPPGPGTRERLLRMQVEKTGQASPESGPATKAAIPSMGLIPVPDYMVTAAPNGEIDKFDLDIMYSEIKILAAMARTLNGLSAQQIAGTAPLPASVRA